MPEHIFQASIAPVVQIADQENIRILREALEKAERGEITELVVCYKDSMGLYHSEYNGHVYTLLGVVDRCKHRMNARLDAKDDL